MVDSDRGFILTQDLAEVATAPSERVSQWIPAFQIKRWCRNLRPCLTLAEIHRPIGPPDPLLLFAKVGGGGILGMIPVESSPGWMGFSALTDREV